MLEFCAGVALRGCAGDYDDDVGVEGWVGGRMMEQLEGVLWGVWLGMDEVEEVMEERSASKWFDILSSVMRR